MGDLEGEIGVVWLRSCEIVSEVAMVEIGQGYCLVETLRNRLGGSDGREDLGGGVVLLRL